MRLTSDRAGGAGMPRAGIGAPTHAGPRPRAAKRPSRGPRSVSRHGADERQRRRCHDRRLYRRVESDRLELRELTAAAPHRYLRVPDRDERTLSAESRGSREPVDLPQAISRRVSTGCRCSWIPNRSGRRSSASMSANALTSRKCVSDSPGSRIGPRPATVKGAPSASGCSDSLLSVGAFGATDDRYRQSPPGPRRQFPQSLLTALRVTDPNAISFGPRGARPATIWGLIAPRSDWIANAETGCPSTSTLCVHAIEIAATPGASASPWSSRSAHGTPDLVPTSVFRSNDQPYSFGVDSR